MNRQQKGWETRLRRAAEKAAAKNVAFVTSGGPDRAVCDVAPSRPTRNEPIFGGPRASASAGLSWSAVVLLLAIAFVGAVIVAGAA